MGDQHHPLSSDQTADLERPCDRATLLVHIHSFLPYLRLALQNLVKKYAPDYLYVNSHSTSTASSGLSTREFAIAFYNLEAVSTIRDLRTEKIGTLLSISGTVTRTSEVRPELVFGAFVCQECKTLVKDVEQQFKYTEVSTGRRHALECTQTKVHTQSDVLLMPSITFLSHSHLSAPTRRVQRAPDGSWPSNRASSPTGRRSGSRRTRMKSLLEACRGRELRLVFVAAATGFVRPNAPFLNL